MPGGVIQVCTFIWFYIVVNTGRGSMECVVRCVGKRVMRLAPTEVVLRYTKVNCRLGVSLGACAFCGKGPAKGVCICRIVHRSTRLLFNFTKGSRHRLFLVLASISKINPGATQVVLSSLSPSRLVQIVTSGGRATLASIGKVKLGATRHVLISLGGGMGPVRKVAIANNSSSITTDNTIARRTITTLIVLKFRGTTSRGTIGLVLGNSPTLTIRRIVGATLEVLWTVSG